MQYNVKTNPTSFLQLQIFLFDKVASE